MTVQFLLICDPTPVIMWNKLFFIIIIGIIERLEGKDPILKNVSKLMLLVVAVYLFSIQLYSIQNSFIMNCGPLLKNNYRHILESSDKFSKYCLLSFDLREPSSIEMRLTMTLVTIKYIVWDVWIHNTMIDCKLIGLLPLDSILLH